MVHRGKEIEVNIPETTDECLLKMDLDDSYDEKWGRFKPHQRFNVDQRPMPFVLDTKRTYQ